MLSKRENIEIGQCVLQELSTRVGKIDKRIDDETDVNGLENCIHLVDNINKMPEGLDGFKYFEKLNLKLSNKYRTSERHTENWRANFNNYLASIIK